MDLHNTYYYFKNAITEQLCDKIITVGENILTDCKLKNISTNAVTFGNTEKDGVNSNNVPLLDKTISEIKEVKNPYIRDSEVCWLNDKWIYDIVCEYVNRANYLAGWKYEWSVCESLQFTKYGINQFYGWHADGNNDNLGVYKKLIPGVCFGENDKTYTTHTDYVGKIRKLSMTLNLSPANSYEGGNLKFDLGPHNEKERYYECEEIRPIGSIIVFPSHVYHQVTPITKGTRYSLVLWCLGNPYK